MSNLREVPVGDPQLASNRYSVSRAGMGGRKPKYTRVQLEAVVKRVRTKEVKSLVKACEGVGPYVSVRSALMREKLWPVVVTETTTPEA